MTLQAVSEPELNNLEVDVVIGENNPHQDALLKLVEARDNTLLHIQVEDMATIMSKADLAIGSGGVNTWERMCLGLPSLVISFAENHKVILGDLAKNGHVHYLGSINNVDELIIKKGVLDIISDQLLIKDQSIKTYKLVDGYGSQKVADWLIGDLSNQQLKIKNTTDEDMELYWIWANDKQVRNNALNKEQIPWENHVKWFQSKLSDKNCSLYLIFIDKKPIGQVRFEKEGDYARIDYSIASQFRGKKLGKKILRLAIHEYQKNNTIKILGEVLPNNIASEKTFESLGFTMEINRGNKIYTKESKDLAKVNV
jgi:RimJ/RimL family protein N-acetyltransferase